MNKVQSIGRKPTHTDLRSKCCDAYVKDNNLENFGGQWDVFYFKCIKCKKPCHLNLR